MVTTASVSCEIFFQTFGGFNTRSRGTSARQEIGRWTWTWCLKEQDKQTDRIPQGLKGPKQSQLPQLDKIVTL